MTDEFLKIVDSRISQVVKELSVINTAPCRVVEIKSDAEVVVELITDNTRYTLPNYSGNYLEVGENAIIYYRGKTIGNGAYVGASLHKGNSGDSTVKYFNMTNRVGSLNRTVSTLSIVALQETTVSVVFNSHIQSDESGTCVATLYVDDVAHPYSPIINVDSNSIMCLNAPVLLSEGEHFIAITLSGTGMATQICAFISGQFIETQQYEETTDDDYIYLTSENGTDIIYYIGESTKPMIPNTINEKSVINLYATSFNYSDIEAVYIPDGVIEIG